MDVDVVVGVLSVSSVASHCEGRLFNEKLKIVGQVGVQR